MLKWVEHITVEKSNWLSYSCDGRKFKYLTFSSLHSIKQKFKSLCSFKKAKFPNAKKTFSIAISLVPLSINSGCNRAMECICYETSKEKLLRNAPFIVKRKFEASIRLWCYEFHFERKTMRRSSWRLLNGFLIHLLLLSF